MALPRECLWKICRNGEVSLGRRPRIMGILNVTPDSFFDGGRYLDSEKAIARGLEMTRQGADILDVGGESTRPGSQPVFLETELERTIPVIAALAEKTDLPISIDTSKAAVAAAALEAGAAIINDISGFSFDRDMARLAVESGAGLVVMHIRGTPADMQRSPGYQDTLLEVRRELGEKVRNLVDLGADPARIVVDPGIGFGKRFEDNLRLLGRLEEFHEMGHPLLVGCSRKSFLGTISDREASDRLFETVAASVLVAAAGCHIVRVHDVEENLRALRVAEAVLGA